jgi:paraquat-inducible protein B
MTDNIQFSTPVEKPKKGISIIWIIPMLALIIGGWMIYQQWQSQGLIVTVSFESAEGLEAGKTRVKSRNVDIGTLKDIYFNEQRTKIIASIEIDKSMSDFLRTDSQFWIVKPRIGAQGISGIGTILSGAYIEVYPGTFTKYADEFVGLERPPITELNAAGLHITLLSDFGSGISVGDPIIYRGFNVGKVQTSSFDTAEKKAKYDIFIASPYESLVTTNTHFWNVGGVSLESSAKGFKLNLATVEALLSGGIEFDVLDANHLGEPISPYKRFRLYQSREDVIENRVYKSFEYVVLVEDSVRGLIAGAPVEYRGIRVGSVISPYITPKQVEKLQISAEDVSHIPVLIKIEPERLLGQSSDQEIEEFNQSFINNIRLGLTANIDSANILTGSLLINLDFNGETTSEMERFGPYLLIPSTREGLAKIQDSLEQMLDSINKLPFDQIANDTTRLLSSADKALVSADKTLRSLRSSVGHLNKLLKNKDTQQLSANLNTSMGELQKTLKGLQPNSGAYRQIEKTMTKLQKTLDDLQPMLKKINNNPSTLIFSTPRNDDLQPRKK